MAGTDLGLCVVLRLLVAADDWPALIRVPQRVNSVAQNTSRAGVDEGLDAGLLAGFDDGGGTVDVHLLEEFFGQGVVGGNG